MDSLYIFSVVLITIPGDRFGREGHLFCPQDIQARLQYCEMVAGEKLSSQEVQYPESITF